MSQFLGTVKPEYHRATNFQLEDIADGFFGDFKTDGHTIDQTYRHDVEKGYIPSDLPTFYKAMRQFPGASYRTLTQGMLLYERITYSENKSVVL